MTCTSPEKSDSPDDELPEHEQQDHLPTALAYGPDGRVLDQRLSGVTQYRLNLPGFISEQILAGLEAGLLLPYPKDEQSDEDSSQA